MKSYLVTYDLIKRKNYPELIEALEAFNYWHCLGSVWIIKSNASAESLCNTLRTHIDDDDKLIVLLLDRESAWTESFPQECSDWLQQNL